MRYELQYDMQNREQGLCKELKKAAYTVLTLKGNISSTDSFTAIAEAIKGSTIQQIDLSACVMEWSDLLQLVRALRGNTTVTSLDFSNHYFKKGTTIQALVAALNTTSITQLKLCNNKLDEVAADLIQALGKTNITQIDFGNNQINGEVALAIANALKATRIFSINLEDNRIGETAWEFIRNLQFTQISVLDLSNNDIKAVVGENSLSVFEKTKLKKLSLSYNFQIDYVSLAKSLKDTCLSELVLMRIASLKGNVPTLSTEQKLTDFLEALIETNVEIIDLSNNSISTYHVPIIAKAIEKTSIKVLKLNCDVSSDPDVMLTAFNFTKVEKLFLEGVYEFPIALKMIQSLKNTRLKVLSLYGKPISQFHPKIESFLDFLFKRPNVHTFLLPGVMVVGLLLLCTWPIACIIGCWLGIAFYLGQRVLDRVCEKMESSIAEPIFLDGCIAAQNHYQYFKSYTQVSHWKHPFLFRAGMLKARATLEAKYPPQYSPQKIQPRVGL